MAYTLKLDTNVVTLFSSSEEGTISYGLSTATIELKDVKAYYSYVDYTGEIKSEYTYLEINGTLILVEETYADIDTLINP